MKTAEQRSRQALTEGAKIEIDHETRSFVAFRFQLSDEQRPTVIRVHRSQAADLLTAAA
ncbi:MAG: hypothetical protein AAGL24_10175 [Pseudomonadota bacterium]